MQPGEEEEMTESKPPSTVPDFGMMTEEEQIAYAMQMSLAGMYTTDQSTYNKWLKQYNVI